MWEVGSCNGWVFVGRAARAKTFHEHPGDRVLFLTSLHFWDEIFQGCWLVVNAFTGTSCAYTYKQSITVVVNAWPR